MTALWHRIRHGHWPDTTVWFHYWDRRWYTTSCALCRPSFLSREGHL